MARKRNRIRLKMDIRAPLVASVDFFSNDTPLMPRARAVQFEIGIFDGANLDDITDIQTITLECKADVDSAALFTQTLAAASLTPGLTPDQWANGQDSYCHAMFTFLEGVTGLNLGGATQKQFILVVTALTSIGNLTVGTTVLTVVNDGGLTAANTPAAGDPAFLRVDQFNALAANFVKVIGDPGVPIILKSLDGTWQRRFGVENDGTADDSPSKIA
jgi:hypothetical protein